MRDLPNIITEQAKTFYADAQLLRDMCSIYPGDPDGTLSREAYILDYMGDLIADYKWSEVLAEYEAQRPKVEVTVR